MNYEHLMYLNYQLKYAREHRPLEIFHNLRFSASLCKRGMALPSTLSSPLFSSCRLPTKPMAAVKITSSMSCSSFPSFRSSANYPNIRNKSLSIRSSSVSVAAAAPSGNVAPVISLSENALKHLNRMKAERNEDLCLRIGVKQGGCSGMSYTMDFENRANAKPDDSIIESNGFVIVCDPKSLLFVYGMQLDFSDALIGGGFSFINPNATKTCGCGKSFATTSPSSSPPPTACTN
ncbi:Iron-sulfur assembly protein IscA, chloroplastic [Cinnamomum micranthum f. kanehirae]|uniref:Iron-sulfur assembly protein IscA, chloroplastic n=1 Tax=Cinnamomum micranthum f. kanehirae TaxID=337451 RepID=A0A443PXY7_9MAGN|nr:Iron-sulfur assembly protein IscA, chloroplastic [Cinnamomum micranthum f. kanehirae]